MSMACAPPLTLIAHAGTVYVIGGIVDRTVRKGVTLGYAVRVCDCLLQVALQHKSQSMSHMLVRTMLFCKRTDAVPYVSRLPRATCWLLLRY